MKKRKTTVLILVAAAALLVMGFLVHPDICGHNLKNVQNTGSNVFYCPMHPNFTSDKPGSCSICGMNLVKKETQEQPKKSGQKKLLYYRNPMTPEVTSPVPMKDSMGMDYVPVYEEGTATQESGVYISPERQQRIGVTKEKLAQRHLVRQINTVGKVAYDPDLYVAQEEYIQALKTFSATKDSAWASVSEQSNALALAAEKKLRLLGMSKNQIEELAKNGQAQDNLFLPGDGDKVWVYMTVYEYDMDLIKEGTEVEVDVSAFPGEVFKGKIAAITPVVNPETRSLQVRAEIENPGGKFRPEMFVNAKINVDLGMKLALPESAVLDTGVRKIVYLVKENDRIEARDVTLGQKAEGYFEVLKDLQEGDTVITSGNFLVDSESKLNAVLNGSEHKHGE